MNNKIYDIMKEFALVWLPAIGAAYFGLSAIWGFPYAEEVVGTITIIDTFIGAVLHISNANYRKEGNE